MSAVKRYVVVPFILVAMLAGVTASMVLASSDSGEVIHACVADRNGDLRIVPPGTECRRGWTPLQWNQEGPPGVSGYEVVEGFWADAEVPPGELVLFQAWCPSDKYVIGGGYAYGNAVHGAVIVEDSFPVTGEGDHKWRVQWRNVSGNTVFDDFQVWAICASASA